ncbi:MAG: PIG-L family deacetylase [Truepera sp.]|nr:PIG-L family deacetylase [Truepera sp.]
MASPLTASPGTIAAMRLLAVFAHPDDELGCIGTLAKHARRGDAVLLVWTTHGELASQFTEDEASVRRIRQEHGATIAKLIGAEHHFFDMGDSMLTGSRREALQLARLYARFQPDAIITWGDDHPHPDHRMTARIAFDAVTLARIPKIINHDLSEPLAPHRRPIHFYQYPSAAVQRPVVHVDISQEIGLACEAFAFYQRFYGWNHTPEEFKAVRTALGREAGVACAEKFQLKQAFLPARDYLF